MRWFDATPRRATPKGHKPPSPAQQHIKSRIPTNDSLLRSWRTIAEYLLVRRRIFVRITPHGTASYGRQLASRIPGTLSKSERQGPA